MTANPLNNISLLGKLILCLLVTSMASTALVGGFAYWRLTKKFNDMVLQESVRRFRADVSDYFRVYGSWEEGRRREPFRAFTDRRNALLGRPGGAIGPWLEAMDGEGPDRAQSQGRMLPGETPESLELTPVRPGKRRLPPSNMHRPPFRFYLFDTDLRSLVNLPPYRAGDKVRQEEADGLLPVETDGRVVAYLHPEGNVSYSDLDLGYLGAMREALLAGSLAGLVLTLALGALLGNHLVRRLRQLANAAQAMGQGEIGKQVQVDGRDEVGKLAATFNRMSTDLAHQYQALHDAKERVETMAAQLRELSTRDALTQLHNRRYFDEHGDRLFRHALRYGRPFSVMLADIDHFKKVNDTYSHAVGDEVLRRIGEILTAKVRASDLVVRYGGEEFVILFPETNLGQAHETCEALRGRIEAHPWHEVHPDLKVTMSIGLSSNTRVDDLQAMLEMADMLLYRAKEGGRNQVCSPANTELPASPLATKE